MADDSSKVRIIWMVVGTVVAALVGGPLVLVTGILTPKASLDAKADITSTMGDDLMGTSRITASVTNTSCLLSAKETSVSIILRQLIGSSSEASLFGRHIDSFNWEQLDAFSKTDIESDSLCKETGQQTDRDEGGDLLKLASVTKTFVSMPL
jgi:hypothetical protein